MASSIRTTIACLAAMVLAAACATPEAFVQGGRERLRDREGLCSWAATPGYGWVGGNRVDTCARLGSPGTLQDDPALPIVKTKVTAAANSPSANTGNWQMEMFRDGVPVWKGMLEKHVVPELLCITGPCWSYSLDVRRVPSWENGTYTFRYTLSFDTSVVLTNTITVQP